MTSSDVMRKKKVLVSRSSTYGEYNETKSRAKNSLLKICTMGIISSYLSAPLLENVKNSPYCIMEKV